MTNLIAVVQTTASVPLVGAFALMAVGVLVSRLLLKQQPIWRAIARVVFLVLLTLLLLHGGIVPYQPLRLTGTPFHDAIAGTLKIAWWLWAAWFLVGLIRSVVVFERRPREGKLVQDRANITALAPSTVYEFAKTDLAPILEARPQIAQELGRALAQQQVAGRALATAELDKTEATRRLSTWFSERIHKLFELTSAN